VILAAAAGLLLGLAGSAHCAAMCGPLAALAAPSGKRAVIYHAGRIGTYLALGTMAGIVGATAGWAGLGHALSIGAAVLLLTLAAAEGWPHVLRLRWPGVVHATRRLLAPVARLARPRSAASAAGLGALNGLLPCGLVYAATTSAAAQDGLAASVVFMAAFGAGTTPLLAGAGLGAAALTARWRFHLRRLVPVVMTLAAVLLLLRVIAAPATHVHS
jgi:sulfite exporter TauE/SafE